MVIVRYKKIRAISSFPSVECGKFKLKKAFQSGKILAFTKKSEASLFHVIWSKQAWSNLKSEASKIKIKIWSKQASSTCMLYYNLIKRFWRIFCTLLLCGVAQMRGHSIMPPPLIRLWMCMDGHSILVTVWNHLTSVFKSCGMLILFFYKKFPLQQNTGCLKSKYTLSILICFLSTHHRAFISSENIAWISSKI